MESQFNWQYLFEDFNSCPCSELVKKVNFPWELMKVKNEFNFEEKIECELKNNVIIGKKVSIGNGTKIDPFVVIDDLVKIGKNCTIRPFVHIRSGSIIGDNVVLGKGSEVKNSIIFNNAKISSNSFVGDSVIGKGARVASGTIIGNRRFDQKEIKIKMTGYENVSTTLDKFGAIIGDYVRIGSNCVTLPGCIIGSYAWIYSCTALPMFVEKNSLLKLRQTIEVVYKKEIQKLSDVDKEGKV